MNVTSTPAMPHNESDKVGALGTLKTPSVLPCTIHILICHLKWKSSGSLGPTNFLRPCSRVQGKVSTCVP